MRSITKLLLVSAAALLAAGTGASAAVVCNDDGDCWHVKGHAEYKPELKLTFMATIGSGRATSTDGTSTRATVTGVMASGSTSAKVPHEGPTR